MDDESENLFQDALNQVIASEPAAVASQMDRDREQRVQVPTLFEPASRNKPAKVCVIAEIGVNHDGSREKAFSLISEAARSGADAVKFQLFHPDRLLSNQAKLATYQQGQANDAHELLRNLTLSIDDLAALREAAKNASVAFIVTPFSLDDVPALKQLNVDAVKIASPDVVNHPLLRAAAELGKPMLVSTGAAELGEIAFAAELLRAREISSCLMQCVSSYPTQSHDAAIGGIRTLSDRFELSVGYSDHTTDLITGALAVAAGACVIEKHFTFDRTAHGPDHAASLDPRNFSEYVRFIRQAAQMHGPLHKSVRGVEKDVREVSRQSVCAKHDLAVGQVLKADDLTIKRPGTGIPATELPQMIGRRLSREVKANDLLRADDIA